MTSPTSPLGPRVLVIGAHPDDEVLGAGGTMAACVRDGSEVSALIVGERVSLRHPGFDLAKAHSTVRAACSHLGVTEVLFGEMPTVGTIVAEEPQPRVVDVVSQALSHLRPSTVITHGRSDIHADHRLVSTAVEYATRNLGLTSVRTILYMEVASSTEQCTAPTEAFFPTVFVDISATLETKLAALREYPHELHASPHPRSEEAVRAGAAWRGAQVGRHAAEAFQLGRALWG